MAKGPPPILWILIAGCLAYGGWYGYRQGWFAAVPKVNLPNPLPQDSRPAESTVAVPPLDTSLPNPAILQMDGSVTMVKLMVGLKVAYSQTYPNQAITYGVPDGRPNGTNKGLQALAAGRTQVAAASRTLKPEEIQAGLVATPIAKDALAVVVGVSNPYKGGLTMAQLAGIFQGQITNWSQVGGPSQPIRVLNRAKASGTHDLFRDLVIPGGNFAPDGANFVTFAQDVTTPILRALGTNGISYTTVAQAVNQQTVRIVPIEGQSPTDTAAIQQGRYPLSRNLFLVVSQKTSPAVKQFIDLALSPQGQQIAARSEFIPLK